MAIHPTAVVDARATIDSSADIGPFVVIDGEVTVGAGTRIGAHAVVLGWVVLGRDNVIHPGAIVGDAPQDLAYRGERAWVRIGDRNVVREHAQIHRGTAPDSATVLGDDNYLMATAHVGHNCRIGSHVIIANGTMLGGYVAVDDRAFLGGNCAVHQHVRVGRLAFMRGGSRADKDVPPFAMLDELNVVRGLNRVGLRRAGIAPEAIAALRRAFRGLFARRCNLTLAMAELEGVEAAPEVRELIAFIRASRRGVGRGPVRFAGGAVAEQ